MDWFPYDNGLRHERVKDMCGKNTFLPQLPNNYSNTKICLHVTQITRRCGKLNILHQSLHVELISSRCRKLNTLH